MAPPQLHTVSQLEPSSDQRNPRSESLKTPSVSSLPLGLRSPFKEPPEIFWPFGSFAYLLHKCNRNFISYYLNRTVSLIWTFSSEKIGHINPYSVKSTTIPLKPHICQKRHLICDLSSRSQSACQKHTTRATSVLTCIPTFKRAKCRRHILMTQSPPNIFV